MTAMDPSTCSASCPSGTTLLEASAGTGKTFAVGALVTRYVAEGHAALEEMLVITFGRAASQELRERVREQLVEAERALADPEAARALGGLVGPARRGRRRRDRRAAQAAARRPGGLRLRDHRHHPPVLPAGAALARGRRRHRLRRRAGGEPRRPDRRGRRRRLPPPLRPAHRGAAVQARRSPSRSPARRSATRRPSSPRPTPTPGTSARSRVDFAREVRAEVDRRKRRLGVLSYDDLLEPARRRARGADDSPARQRMRQRWKIVLVDEFQDTDPVQWKVLDRAFTGHATMVLIGDPKQAIYAFRGGDIFTYLAAADTAATRHTLAINWRSDAPLVDGAAGAARWRGAGRPPDRRTPGRGAPRGQPPRRRARAPIPLRLRQLRGADPRPATRERSRSTPRGRHIAQDLADDVARLLASGATFDGRPVGRRRRRGPDLQPQARRPLPEGPLRSRHPVGRQRRQQRAAHRGGRRLAGPARGAGAAAPVGAGAVGRADSLRRAHRRLQLDAGGDDLTDDVAERVRRWLDLLRSRGIAAVHEAIVPTVCPRGCSPAPTASACSPT